jgi:hypothetical protein
MPSLQHFMRLVENELRLDPSSEAMYWFHDRESDTLDDMVDEFLSGRYRRQPWRLVPAARLQRIWRDYSTTGIVRNVKGLEAIVALFINNIVRLSINTDIAGHSTSDPADMLEPRGIDGDDIDKFVDWAVDIGTGWRISDYGFPRLSRLAALMHEADSPEDMLIYADMVLNTVHQRSNLASWFVQGGIQTLSDLSRS